jgi:hypothetical protein
MDIYNNNYVTWKNWTSDNFGSLTNIESSYFNSLFKILKKRTVIDLRIKALEIGFGNGSFLTYCKNNSIDIVGIECNDFLVRVAKERGYSAYLSDGISTCDHNSLNMIFAFDVLEHLSTENLFSLFSDAHIRLIDQGIFVARFPNGDSPLGLVNQNGDFSHLSAIGSGKIKFLTEKFGYEIIYIGKDLSPIFVSSWKHFFHRIYLSAVTIIVNYLVNVTFFPRRNVEYCSQNMLVILQKNNR